MIIISKKRTAIFFLFSLVAIFSYANNASSVSKHSTTITNFNSTKFGLLIAINAPVTFVYDIENFKSGTKGFSVAKVSPLGGSFSYERKSAGQGELIINTRTGMIDHFISDPGEYVVTYTVANQKAIKTINIQ